MTQFFLEETRENQPVRFSSRCASQAAALPTGTLLPNTFRCRVKVAAHLAAQIKQISLSNLDSNKGTGDPLPPGATAKRLTVCLAQGWSQRCRMHRVPRCQPTSTSRGLCPSSAFACMLRGLCLPSARGSLIEHTCALKPPRMYDIRPAPWTLLLCPGDSNCPVCL